MEEYINVSLVISTDDNYADVITKRLDITPTRIRDKHSFKIKEFAHCERIYSTGNLKVCSLSDAVIPILTVFGEKRDAIASLTKEINGKCDIVVVISAFSGDGPEVVIDKDLISFSNDIGAEIGIDPYFYDRE